jgi:hypothetical protein
MVRMGVRWGHLIPRHMRLLRYARNDGSAYQIVFASLAMKILDFRVAGNDRIGMPHGASAAI